VLEAKQSGNVVEDFTIGNTRIKICDDFCRTRTSGEVKEILNRVARRTVGSLTAPSVSALSTAGPPAPAPRHT